MIVYDSIPKSPVGSILFGARSGGLCALFIGRGSIAAKRNKLIKMFAGETVKRDPHRMKKYRNELMEYFAGKRKRFSFELDLDGVKSPFQRRILRLCSRIPFGQVTSYGALAKKAGSPGAARAVGGAMRINPLPIVIPCHRVITSSGDLGGYTGGLVYKKILITHEGRAIRGKRISKLTRG